MTAEEVIAEQNKKIEALTSAIEKITAKPEPIHIDASGKHTVEADLAKVASGEIIIDLPQQKKPLVEPKENEILASDRVKIGQHIEDIAAGRMAIIPG